MSPTWCERSTLPRRAWRHRILVRDADGQKMSKTKGNGLDPLDFIDGISLDELVQKRTSNLTQPQMAEHIEKSTRQEFADGIKSYGTDALRFTFASLATTGKDARFDVKRLEGYRNFCNKLWNAAKFVLANTENYQSEKHGADRSSINSWINTKTNNLIKNADYAIDTYRFDLYANHLYEFIWHEYCDWFLEFSKTILWDKNQSESVKIETQKTMLEVLEAVLRLAHPVIPFITETIWLSLAKRLGIEEETIMLESFPSIDDFKLDQKAHTEIEWLKSVVSGIRNIRGEMLIKPSVMIRAFYEGGDKIDRKRSEDLTNLIREIAGLESLEWMKDEEKIPPSAAVLVKNLKILIH